MDNSTNPARLQDNVVNTTLPLATIKQQTRDIESLVLTAQTLGELSFEQIDRLGELISHKEKDGLSAVLRLDALMKSINRSLLLIEEAAGAILEALQAVKGAAA